MLRLIQDETKPYLCLCSCDIPISKHTSFTVFYQTTFHIAKPTKKCTTSPPQWFISQPSPIICVHWREKIRLSVQVSPTLSKIECHAVGHTHTYTHAAAGRGWTPDAPELETRARGVGFGRCLSSCQLLFQSLACHW